MGSIKFTLNKTLNEFHMSRNKLAVQARIRPATIADMVNGKTKRIELPTLVSILDALNREGIRKVTVDDVFQYYADDSIG
jgi:DNA-binding Xre family transcriptional regulator